MNAKDWESFRMPSRPEDRTWEFFHENSKTGRLDAFPSQEEVLERMGKTLETLGYDEYPEVPLSASLAPFKLPLEAALLTRATARRMKPAPLSLEAVSTLLHCCYGVTRSNADTPFPRPFRVVPSGGALYPLELYVHSAHVEGLAAGIHHYDPARRSLRHLRQGDLTPRIADALVPFQSSLAFDASLVLFVTALFERSTFKYGARGYRFVLLEAGHVAQNLNLCANALGLGCVNLGGYFDREVDELLWLDGLTQSTVYMIAIGQTADQASP